VITIKQVETEKDYQICLKIRRKIFIEEQNVPERMEVDEFEKEAIHFLAFYQSHPAATGRIRINKGFVKFERVATLEKYRGKGIASGLMQEMQKVAIERFPTYLPAMHAQVKAVSFYVKLGWVQVGELFEEAGIEHQMMILLPKKQDLGFAK
jgi:predicted GNAT family N-acyltransferase